MWFRYFITFLDIALACILVMSLKKDKAIIAGFSAMILAYVASAFLMWG